MRMVLIRTMSQSNSVTYFVCVLGWFFMTFTFILIITCFISLWYKEKKNEISQTYTKQTLYWERGKGKILFISYLVAEGETGSCGVVLHYGTVSWTPWLLWLNFTKLRSKVCRNMLYKHFQSAIQHTMTLSFNLKLPNYPIAKFIL